MAYIISGANVIELSKGAIWSVAGVALAITIAFYLLKSIGLYIICKKQDTEVPWLAFIPIAWIYLIGRLAGQVNFFGKTVKNFGIIVVIIYALSEILALIVYLMIYVPIAGFYIEGGEIYISSSLSSINAYLGNASNVTKINVGEYFALVNFKDPYTDATWAALNILSYIQNVLSLVSLIFMAMTFSGFYRAFFPKHYFIATLFSVFGMCGPFIFAIRNNDRVNYNEYMRERYRAFYGNDRSDGGPYGGNNNGNYDNNGNYGGGNRSDDPFGDFDGKDNHSESDDPFDEFDDRGRN